MYDLVLCAEMGCKRFHSEGNSSSRELQIFVPTPVNCWNKSGNVNTSCAQQTQLQDEALANIDKMKI